MAKLRFEHYVIVASFAALLAGSLLFGQRQAPSKEEEETRGGQSRAPTRSGALALWRVLRQHGVQIVRYERRVDLLHPSTRVLLSVASPVGFDADEAAGLERWIRGGGTFLWLPRTTLDNDGVLLAAARLEYVPHEGEPEERSFSIDASPVDPALGRAYSVVLSRRARLRSPKGGPVGLGGDDRGWVAACARLGRGRLIVFADPRPARNDAILHGDHAALLTHLVLACADGGPVAFDDYHHGYAEGQTPVAYLLDTPAGGAILNLAVLAALVLLGAGRRLGPARTVHEERRRRPAEFIEAYARLCRASRATGPAIALVLGHVLDSLQRRFGATDDAVIGREAARRGLDAKKALQSLEAAKAASRGRPAPAEMVRSLRDLETLRRALLASKEK